MRAPVSSSVGDRQVVQERLAVGLSLQPVAGGLFAIPGRLLAISRGPDPTRVRRSAIEGGLPAALRRAQQDVRRRPRASLVCPPGVAQRHLAVVHSGDLVAGQRRHVARVRNRVTCGCGLDAATGGLPALPGAAIAKITRRPVRVGIAALGEVDIASRLIAIGRVLIAVGSHLVGIREPLVEIGEPLFVGELLRRRVDPLLLIVARSVCGLTHGTAARR